MHLADALPVQLLMYIMKSVFTSSVLPAILFQIFLNILCIFYNYLNVFFL